MLRPATPADTAALVALADGTGVFKPHEIEALQEVLDDFHATNHEYDHRSHVWEENGRPVGFVYYAPTAMTDRTWELWWIVVDRSQQGRGLGRRLLEWVEQDVRHAGGRILFIETSSLPQYVPTRGFYLKNEYRLAAQIADFYSAGDDKVIYSKNMCAPLA